MERAAHGHARAKHPQQGPKGDSPTTLRRNRETGRAGIVFDYNAPIITNTATTTVFVTTAVLARHDAPAWTAYPNPATDAVTLAADLATAGLVRVELLDILGRPLRQQTLSAPAGPLRQTVDLRGLTAGV